MHIKKASNSKRKKRQIAHKNIHKKEENKWTHSKKITRKDRICEIFPQNINLVPAKYVLRIYKHIKHITFIKTLQHTFWKKKKILFF